MHEEFNTVFDFGFFDAVSKANDVHRLVFFSCFFEAFRFVVSTHGLVPVELV